MGQQIDLRRTRKSHIMPSLRVEEAAASIRALAGSDLAQQLRGANEAATRLLVIDKVLAILGWQEHEYNPERVTSTGACTDYLLTTEDKPRLIVEAKRWWLILPLPRPIQNPAYQNSFLWSSCGAEMQDLLEQCRRYCSDCGVPYALATTGEIWVVLIGFRSGVEWGKLRSFVFHSLDDVARRFAEFNGLVSREAVKSNSLEDKFGSMVLVKPNAAIRPRDRLNAVGEVGEVPERRTIEAFFEYFMDDITHPNQEDMLDHCYVKTRALTEFTRDLQRLLEYDPVLDEQETPIEIVDEEKLETEIGLQQDSGNPRTILLVGNIGAGKSTFVHRFLRGNARPRKNICVVVDMINQAAIETRRDRTEEQHLSKLIFSTAADATDEYQDRALANSGSLVWPGAPAFMYVL